MTTAPNRPLAMCADIGIVEQWYIQTPARVAREPVDQRLARARWCASDWSRGEGAGVEVDRVADRRRR